MGIPWKKDEDVNISSNEYTTKLSINRCFNRLLDNDLYLDGIIEAAVDRSTRLRFATEQQIKDLDPVSGAISPFNVMLLSATYNETLTGVSTVDRFITPITLNDTFANNELLPKVAFIDIIYRGKLSTIKQIVDSAIGEITGFDPVPDTLITVRALWSKIDDTQSQESLLISAVNKVVTDKTFSGYLSGHEDRFWTFRATDVYGEWEYVRQRSSYTLDSYEQSTGKKSTFSI